MDRRKKKLTHRSTPETQRSRRPTWRHHALSVGGGGEVWTRIALGAVGWWSVEWRGREHGHVHAPAVILGLRRRVGVHGTWLWADESLMDCATASTLLTFMRARSCGVRLCG